MFHIDMGWAWRGIVPETEFPQWKLARMFSFKARESRGSGTEVERLSYRAFSGEKRLLNCESPILRTLQGKEKNHIFPKHFALDLSDTVFENVLDYQSVPRAGCGCVKGHNLCTPTWAFFLRPSHTIISQRLVS